MAHFDFHEMFRVKPGKHVRLRDYDPSWTGGVRDDEHLAELMQKNLARLTAAQEKLWASENNSVLIVLQAMDTAGKDGLIRHVMSGVNPQSCYVVPFRQPTAEELSHVFLWRYARRVPALGHIGIFNRSHYEEVLVVRVHPELLAHERTAPGGGKLWKQRYDDINHFEHHLTRNRTVILKFFLHLSKKEQKKRLLARLDDPDKHWKFSPADLAEREFWHDYQQAYEDMLSATSTDDAPWFIVPADHKFITHWVASEIITRAIRRLDLKVAPLTPDQEKALARARKSLSNE